jgi:hypothetical protein
VVVKLQAERQCEWWIKVAVGRLTPVNPCAMYDVLLALFQKSYIYSFEEEIRIAARGAVGRPIIRPWNKAYLITATDRVRLLMYHSECKNTLLEAEEDIWRNAGMGWPWFKAHCSSWTTKVGDYHFTVTQWPLDFCSRVKAIFCEELRGERHRGCDSLA